MAESEPRVGIVANPVSARDIRRVIANATSLQVADRANIVLRVLAALGACGVQRVAMMPEKGGIRGLVDRGLRREINLGERVFPELDFVATPVTGTVEDTLAAVEEMVDVGVAAIVVLGGDGTHRAVVKRCGNVPISGISTGTNNAFPEYREPTITGLAVGLAATGRVPETTAIAQNKMLRVDLNHGAHKDIALVDVAISAERHVGARALWRTESFRELFVTFADPQVIGMSAIAGLIAPLGRDEPGGIHLRLGPPAEAGSVFQIPIAPGLMRPIGVHNWNWIDPGEVVTVRQPAGVVGLDGEREIQFGERDRVTVSLVEGAFRTIDVRACMHYAARHKLFAQGALRSLRITLEEES